MIEPKHVPDTEVLKWINDGLLVVKRLNDPAPIVIFRGRILKPELTQQGGRNRICGTSRWTISFKFRGRRRKIVRSKLVYMFVHRVVIPDGYHVDHDDEDRLNDAANNLIMLNTEEHLEKHYGVF